jgi:hypothetical protein
MFKLFLALIQLSFLRMDGIVASREKALDEYRESVNKIKNTETKIIDKFLTINAYEIIL